MCNLRTQEVDVRSVHRSRRQKALARVAVVEERAAAEAAAVAESIAGPAQKVDNAGRPEAVAVAAVDMLGLALTVVACMDNLTDTVGTGTRLNRHL